jgi:hypothetical protein
MNADYQVLTHANPFGPGGTTLWWASIVDADGKTLWVGSTYYPTEQECLDAANAFAASVQETAMPVQSARLVTQVAKVV